MAAAIAADSLECGRPSRAGRFPCYSKRFRPGATSRRWGASGPGLHWSRRSRSREGRAARASDRDAHARGTALTPESPPRRWRYYGINPAGKSIGARYIRRALPMGGDGRES